MNKIKYFPIIAFLCVLNLTIKKCQRIQSSNNNFEYNNNNDNNKKSLFERATCCEVSF